MQLGFAIDQRTCIGCHACTVACKTENDVPIGQFRTWVKYVDSGEFPDTTRSFGVMRCNHCTDAPCVKICPTQALFKREDGIVDFDNSRCIGCKSCMQACPYDAIYIDAETHTAAKCNLCAHRVDNDLEPACVVVCPTHSIWVGDLDDPTSGISKLVNTNQTAVRTPEQNTGPNVFYLGADQAVLDPLAAPVDDTYIWAKPDAHRLETAGDLPGNPRKGSRTTLNTAHPRPWGWKVVTYLWTKGIGAGALAVAALAVILGVDFGVLGDYVAPALALFGAATTGGLLVWDLKRPERFLYIFLKSNFTSWLVLGAYVLTLFSGGSVLWLLAAFFDVGWAMTALAWLAIPAAAMMAGYTAFLFGQAEGRDLWQSPVLFWHLQAQAVMVGSGALAVFGLFLGPRRRRVDADHGLVRDRDGRAPGDPARGVRRQAREPSGRHRCARDHQRPVLQAVLDGQRRPDRRGRGDRCGRVADGSGHDVGRAGRRRRSHRPARAAGLRERVRPCRTGHAAVVTVSTALTHPTSWKELS